MELKKKIFLELCEISKDNLNIDFNELEKYQIIIPFELAEKYNIRTDLDYIGISPYANEIIIYKKENLFTPYELDLNIKPSRDLFNRNYTGYFNMCET